MTRTSAGAASGPTQTDACPTGGRGGRHHVRVIDQRGVAARAILAIIWLLLANQTARFYDLESDYWATVSIN
jgi:hypothetical protein